MAKRITDVVLKEGAHEVSFIEGITKLPEVELKDRVESIDKMVVLNVEESYLETLKSHHDVKSAEFFDESPTPVTYPSVPSVYTLANKSIGGTTYWNNFRGDKMLSYQHYLDTDHIPDPTPDRTVSHNGQSATGHTVGNHYYYGAFYGQRDNIRHFGSQPASDHGTYGSDSTYYSTYTGKFVDIVVVEGGSSAPSAEYQNYHVNHPDYLDPDTGSTRMIPMNWPGLSNSHNNQVSSGIMLNGHSVGTLSAAGGIVGGFAKRSKMYAAYITGHGITATLNSIKSWHQSKSNNPATGFPNPTVIVTEWHHPVTTRKYSIRVNDVTSVTSPSLGTVNRPYNGWGSNLTPFVQRNIIPFQLLDPVENSWYWTVNMGAGIDGQPSYHTAMAQCWDAGIHIVTSEGNGGAVSCQTTQPEFSGTYVDTSGSINLYTHNFPASGNQNDPVTISRSTTNTSRWYVLRPYGPGGLAKSINVAAGGNSEGCPALDDYTARGPQVDVIGRGRITFTAGTPTATQLQDNFRWMSFGGTSCAMPTVAGKVACYVEKHYTINGVYPTPDQVKASMISEAKATAMSVATTTWANVPNASNSPINPGQQATVDTHCLKDKSGYTGGNGGHAFLDHAGTPCRQAYWNAQNFNREQTYKKRPTSGVLFPRPRKFDIPPIEEAATANGNAGANYDANPNNPGYSN